MTRFLVFCDGTWNTPEIKQPTHVVQLSNTAAQTSDQKVKYIKGVGVGGFILPDISNPIYKYVGGAVGLGLNKRVKQGYKYLAKNYKPGDEIMIFGFSRGAYTARSLAGMIRKCGFPPRVRFGTVGKAFTLYRKSGPQNAPDKPHIMQERKEFSPGFATSKTDQDWRGNGSSLIKITYLGIWDTVGALGIPEPLLGGFARGFNKVYQFHDTDLSSTVHSARHAVALDERRKLFDVTPWDNLDRLNDGRTGPDRPYQQMWFIGDHGMVGGSGTTRPLTSITLDWIAQGAQAAGMKLKSLPSLLDAAPDPTVKAPVAQEAGLFGKLAPDLKMWRKGPRTNSELSPTVRDRTRADSEYRPGSLAARFL
jgi:uncharacterized protein (DUF2235 family)